MKRLNPRLRALLVVLIPLVLVVLVLGLLWATNTFGWRRWRIQEVQAFIGAPLPAEAANIQFATQSDHTRIIWLRFALPDVALLDAWLRTIDLAAPLRQGFTPFPAPNPQEAAYPWWTPRDAAAFSGLHANTGRLIYELVVNQDSLPTAEVFLRVYAINVS